MIQIQLNRRRSQLVDSFLRIENLVLLRAWEIKRFITWNLGGEEGKKKKKKKRRKNMKKNAKIVAPVKGRISTTE